MSTVAGVLLLTLDGAAPAVAARLRGEPGITLAGGDGRARVAAVWEGADGAALERCAERLMREIPELLGIYPTFVGAEER